MKPYLSFATIVSVILILIGLSASSAPFVTSGMMRRNGLTDEQYELLWKQGKTPVIDIATARDWIYRASRYENVVEWLNICGRSNDFARLSHKLQGDNFSLEETNKIVVANNRELCRTNAIVVAENSILFATNAVLEVSASKAQKIERSAQKAKNNDSKNFAKWISDTEKAKKKSSDEMAEFYDSILEIANAEVNDTENEK